MFENPNPAYDFAISSEKQGENTGSKDNAARFPPALEVDWWKLHAGRIDRLAIGPGIGLCGHTLSVSVGFESARMTGRSLILDMASITFCVNVLPTVLTQMMVRRFNAFDSSDEIARRLVLMGVRLLEIERGRLRVVSSRPLIR